MVKKILKLVDEMGPEKESTLSSLAFLLGIAIVGFFLTACAIAAKPKSSVVAEPAKTDEKLACTEQPQWVIKDGQGRPFGIYVCFADGGQLRYTARGLPPPPPANAPPAEIPAGAAQKPKPRAARRGA